jgi:Flp pilus assembly pilin Flp
MLAAVAVVIVAAVFGFGTAVAGTFERGVCALTPGQTPETDC